MKATKYLAIVAALAVAATMSARAASITINWGAASSTELDDAGGTCILPLGDLVEVGIFTGGGYGGGSSLSNFSVFASGHIGDGVCPPGSGVIAVLLLTRGLPICNSRSWHSIMPLALIRLRKGSSSLAMLLPMLTLLVGKLRQARISPQARPSIWPIRQPDGSANVALAPGVSGFYTGTTTDNNGGMRLGSS